LFGTVINIMNMIIVLILQDSDSEQNMKGNEDEYNKGFFTATNAYGNTHIYLLYIYYREGNES
jgi:hypothetical protein